MGVLKLRKTIGNKNGFTLTELLIGMLITAIMGTAIVSLFIYITNTFSGFRKEADANIILMNLNDRISNDVFYADEIECPETDVLVLKTYDGKILEYTAKPVDESDENSINVLYLNGSPVFGKQYYEGNSLFLTFEKINGNTVRILFEIKGDKEISKFITVSTLKS